MNEKLNAAWAAMNGKSLSTKLLAIYDRGRQDAQDEAASWRASLAVVAGALGVSLDDAPADVGLGNWLAGVVRDSRNAAQAQTNAYNRRLLAQLEQEWAGVTRLKKAYEDAQAQSEQPVSGADGLLASPTRGMNLGQRIAHVGGRENAQGYVEFGSPMAVDALIQHILRDMTTSTQEGAFQARYRIPGGPWTSWGAVTCGVKGHEQELRYLATDAQPQPSGNSLPEQRAATPADNAMERALMELVDKIVPGLDTGDLVADASTASKALDRVQPSGNAGELPPLPTYEDAAIAQIPTAIEKFVVNHEPADDDGEPFRQQLEAALQEAFDLGRVALAAQASGQDDTDPTPKSQYRSMFHAACVDLGRINEALGLDPDDGGADPILEVIEQLRAGGQGRPVIARALSEWHEDDGNVMWWAWCGHEWAGEPAWIGTPLDDDWPGYHTHWTAHSPVPRLAGQASGHAEWVTHPDLTDVPDELMTPASLAIKQAQQDAEDAARLDWLRDNSCDLRCANVATGGDDSDIQWIVIEHHMATPHEREIGRSLTDNPREAIDAAIAAEKEKS